MSKPIQIVDIASVCHDANRALCIALGDYSQSLFPSCESWQRDSAMVGVEFNLENPGAPASASHDSWLAVKEADGWTYGPVKDVINKQHPCFVPYEELPPEQQAKDHLFKAVVAALAPLLEGYEKQTELTGLVGEDGRHKTKGKK
jgi:hypothetical protein